MQPLTVMSALPITVGPSAARSSALPSLKTVARVSLALPKRVVPGKSCGGCRKCGRCRVTPSRSRTLAVPTCSLSARLDCHAPSCSEPCVGAQDQVRGLWGATVFPRLYAPGHRPPDFQRSPLIHIRSTLQPPSSHVAYWRCARSLLFPGRRLSRR